MRAWPASKEWMRNLVRRINYHACEEDEDGNRVLDEKGEPIYVDGLGEPHTYADAIQTGHDMANGGYAGFGSDEGADYFREGRANTTEFFKHWCVLTGKPWPKNVDMDDPNVSCAC